MAVLDSFTMVAGYVAPYGSYYGFRSSTKTNPIGTINGSNSSYGINSNWYSQASITVLERGSDPGFTGIRLNIIAPGDPGNSGWADIRIKNSSFIYNRVDASSSTINSGYGREWLWSGSANPFVNGGTYDFEVTDNGVGSGIESLPRSGESISINDLRNYFDLTTPPYNLNNSTIRDHLGKASGAQNSLSEYYFDGYFLRNGNDATNAVCAQNVVYSQDVTSTDTYVGIRVKYTRISSTGVLVQFKPYGYSNSDAISTNRSKFSLGGVASSLSTTEYTNAFFWDGYSSSKTYLAIQFSSQVTVNYGSGSQGYLTNNDATVNTNAGSNTFYNCPVGGSIGKTMRSYSTSYSAGVVSGKAAIWTLDFKIGEAGGANAQTIAKLRVFTKAESEFIDNFN